jgi:hypothetical protein
MCTALVMQTHLPCDIEFEWIILETQVIIDESKSAINEKQISH